MSGLDGAFKAVCEERDELAGALRALVSNVRLSAPNKCLAAFSLADYQRAIAILFPRMTATDSEMTPASAQNAETVKPKQDLA